jgi:protein ImuB
VEPVRTLAVRCADWPAVATGRPPHVPVAVVHANRVVSVSPAARAQGVEAGLRRREAQARCPAVEVHERDDGRDARAFEGVLAALEDLAPRLEVTAPGSCAVPTIGPSRYHGGDGALAALVLARVHGALAAGVGRATDGVVCTVGVGVADGPRAAGLVADEAVRRGGDRPLVVPPGATAEFLAPLPIARLARGEDDLVDVLRRLGLRTVGRFAALPAPDVLARFGAAGLDLHRLVRGQEDRPPNVGEPPPDLRVSAAIDPPAERVDRAAFTAKALADTLHDELSSRGLACTRVLVVAETEMGDRIERLWRHEGALSAAAIAQRVRWQLEGWLGSGRSVARCTGGVSRVELVPDEVVPDDGRQLGFWGGSSEAGERALRALARVQALVGADAVLVPEWQGGRSPAEQYRLVPLETIDPVSRPGPGPEPWPGALPAPAPAVVWPRPLAADVTDADGRRVGVGGRGLISAPPVHCSVDGGPWCAVRAWAGPWCVEERWWDPIGHRRRARLQVVLAAGDAPGHPSAGTAHLLTLEAGRWWLEATYD